MKVIKSINNNVSHCLDSKGREVIAFGKGIGFFKSGEEIPLNKINRTFYNIKDSDYGVIKNISTVVLNTSIEIIDYVSDKLNINFPSSTAMTLADHLQFAIERKEQNIYLPQPLIQDLIQLYPDEMNAAHDALKIIKRNTGVTLPRSEAGTLAMHFINDHIQINDIDNLDNTAMIEACTRIIEKMFSIEIDRNSFNYSRFVSHLDYLIRRLVNNDQTVSKNEEMYKQVSQMYPDTLNCVEMIDNYIYKKIAIRMNREEQLYLIVHVNRLIARI